MTPDQSATPAETPAAPARPTSDMGMPLTVDDVRHPYLPYALRGYDKREVDRYITRVAEAYGLSLEKHRTLRERVRNLEADLNAANLDAQASARSVREMMEQLPAESNGTNQAMAELEERYQQAVRDRDR